MTDTPPKASSFELLLKITSLAEHFNSEASSAEARAKELRHTAETLNEAAAALRAEQEKNRQLQQKLDAVQKVPAQKSLSFLVDASSSMGVNINGTAPYAAAFEGIEHVALKNNITVNTAVWGGREVIPVTAENYDAVRSGNLNSGSDFEPAIDYMQAHAKEKHFVVLTDGDLFLTDAATKRTIEFVAANPDVTIDFVFMTRIMSESTRNFVTGLVSTYPSHTSVQMAEWDMNCTAAIERIQRRRLNAPTDMVVDPRNNPNSGFKNGIHAI